MEAQGEALTTAGTTWRRQSVWSQAASAQKREIRRARSLLLALGIAAAALGTASGQLMGPVPWLGRACAVAAAFAAAGLPFATGRCGSQALADWTRLRAVSESLKSEVYVSLAGAGRYRTAPSEAETRLRGRLIELELHASDLARHLQGVEPLARPLPPVRGFDDYVRERVVQQVLGYYRPQSLVMRSRTTLLRRLEVALALVGTLQGALAGGFGIAQLGVWIAVVTTIATAVTAHAAAGRYAYQEIEYSRTAQELEALRLSGPSSTSDIVEQDRFIARCEDVISVQNDAWMVKWAGA
ncbi:DUF4231 domain-containing protein [Streptomyces sp. HUAS 31]|uniref:DUF4231 domain-containing protein n=1 Tax=Streptomyces TaxID=1883 RepID=UPI002305042B|nr:DUF4231 domain-containing protein [Streptomyces sp. HUAS 31]WCE00388.1 DUF4231 domain-containing protein [Streptomyces sp. HUAS 31]